MSKLINKSIETRLTFNVEVDRKSGCWVYSDLENEIHKRIPDAIIDNGGWRPCYGWIGPLVITIPLNDSSICKIIERVVKRWENKWVKGS